MGVNISVTRSKIYNELDVAGKEKFDIVRRKAIHNIDTLYYSIKLSNDDIENENEDIKKFLYFLNFYKNDSTLENEIFDDRTEFVFNHGSFSFYKYKLSYGNLFDVFIAENLPNVNTPRIVVQIRSAMLWGVGDKSALIQSFNRVKKLLEFYNLEIKEVNENRIDFCYHCNFIQKLDTYFSDDVISNYLISTFKIGSKVFRKDHKKLTYEYLSLGNRKSNNLFFRTYNKTREVVEMGYKDFFLDIWYDNGLISQYDLYVYTYCYQKRSYDQRYVGMMKYYIEFGKDEFLKNRFENLLSNENTTLEQVRKAIKGICPEPTIIQNVEFQTMRKFYYNSYDLISTLPLIEDFSEIELLRIMQILDNRKIFLDYLLTKTVCFTKKDIDSDFSKLEYKDYMADWWLRIFRLKLDETVQVQYKRLYKNSNNIEYNVNRLISTLATISVLKDKTDSNLLEDLSSFICSINDNDDYLEYKNAIYDIKKNKKKKAQKNINEFKSF